MRAAEALFVLALLGAAASPASAWPWLGARAKCPAVEPAPAVDGRAEDWRLEPNDESQGLAYGFSRDARYLYMVFVPHTREAKDQLGGLYGQDVVLWLDPAAKKNKLKGLLVLAPAQLDETARALEPIRISTAADGGAEAAAAVGALENRGAFEARVPLSWLGTPLPKDFTVGLEAQTPRHPPALPPPAGARDGREPAPAGAKFESVSLWVRVSLPETR